MPSELDEFLAAIAVNPCDCELREVFADWLEEQSDPNQTEIDRQRRWKEVMAESRKWLESVARRMEPDEEDEWGSVGGEMTYTRLMNAANEWVETDDGRWGGESLTQVGGQSWQTMFEDEQLVADFWRHYEIVTGRSPKTKSSFFSCSC